MWRKKSNTVFYVFIAIFAIGLIMAISAYALDNYYKSHMIDKNGDGVVNWKDADVNGDGKVDIHDIALVAGNTGPDTPGNVRYDLNGDGVVDGMDAAICASYFGSYSLSIFNLYSAQSKLFVTSLVIAVLGFLGMFFYRPKMRR